MKWYKISLSRDEVTHGELHKILKLFCDILHSFNNTNSLKSIVMLESISANEHLIYFSPSASNIPAIVDLINIYSGSICESPCEANLGYLAGDIEYAQNFLN